MRSRTVLFLLGAAALAGVGLGAVRHGIGSRGRRVPGGILIGDPEAYDALSHRLLLGSLYRGIAADVAAVTQAGARVLEVGCGPGHLSIQLARDHGLEVTGLDLDPAMIELAGRNAERAGVLEERDPSFVVGDVAALPFTDGSFDLVVSTMSMHHWTDPAAGLVEIGRVLAPGGRALIWDIRRGGLPFHRHVPDPSEHLHGGPLRLASVTPWRWPWRLHLTQRIELART